MTEATIEQMIVAMEKKGWRLSCLSFIGNARAYSCILERKLQAQDGAYVYAFNNPGLHTYPRDAVADAWSNAQEPIANKRVVQQVKAGPVIEGLAGWLNDNPGHRVKLEDALYAHINLLTGVEEAEDDFL